MDSTTPYQRALRDLRVMHPTLATVYDRHQTGQKLREIAATLGIQEAAVHKRNARANAYMRDRYIAYGGGSADGEGYVSLERDGKNATAVRLFSLLIGDPGETKQDRGAAAWEIRESQASGSVIYFVQATTGGAVKVGTSVALEARLRALQQASSAPLVLLGVLRGGTHLEHLIHRKFAGLRLQGEWFDDAPELMAFIAEVTNY